MVIYISKSPYLFKLYYEVFVDKIITLVPPPYHPKNGGRRGK